MLIEISMHANQASCSLAAVSKMYLATATHERWNALSFVSHDEVIIAHYKQELIFLQSTYAALDWKYWWLNKGTLRNKARNMYHRILNEGFI